MSSRKHRLLALGLLAGLLGGLLLLGILVYHFLSLMSPDAIKVDRAKASKYYGKWKTEALLVKYCDQLQWRFDKENDRVEFRGVLKKNGAELVVRFFVSYGWVDKSNTREDWVILDEDATLGGKELPNWRSSVFADEYRLMGGNQNDK